MTGSFNPRKGFSTNVGMSETGTGFIRGSKGRGSLRFLGMLGCEAIGLKSSVERSLHLHGFTRAGG